MKITTENLAVAASLLDRLKPIEEAIQNINRLAVKAAETETIFTINLKEFDPYKPPQIQIGKLPKPPSFHSGGLFAIFEQLATDGKENDNSKDGQFEISGTTALQVFGVLLAEQITKRDQIITDIKKLKP